MNSDAQDPGARPRLSAAGHLLDLEEQRCRPWAMTCRRSRGRRSGTDGDPWRTPYQRDRDRIVHSVAFRRLMGKTQVLLADTGDHFRVRLTHSVEVAQIARSIARNLGLNEDLTEAVALAHDLGHPPFGHGGGDVLDELMRDHGGFEHNRHSLRIVDRLERRFPGQRGLDLSYEVRESIIKHKRPFRGAEYDPYHPEEAPLLEAQVVDLADGIAYLAHDLDDGFRAHILEAEEVEQLEIWRRAADAVRERDGRLEGLMLRTRMVTTIINEMVCDLLEHTEDRLERAGITTIDDVRAADLPLVGFGEEMARMEKELRAFLYRAFYSHHLVVRMRHRGEIVLSGLFRAYCRSPRLLPPVAREHLEEDGLERIVCDYVAGMTDRYAQKAYAQLYHPGEGRLEA